MKCSEALTMFITALDGARSKATISTYRSLIKRFVAFVNDKDLAKVTLRDLEAWRASIASDFSSWTAHQGARVIRRWFCWLADEALAENIAKRLTVPKNSIHPKPGIGYGEMLRMIETAKSVSKRDYALMLFFADTGCRRGGAASLKLGDLDLPNRTAYVCEKGNKKRAVFLKAMTVNALTDYLGERLAKGEDGDPVFTGNFYHGAGGKPLGATGIYRTFKRTAKLANVKGRWNPHQWRHGFARGMLKRGANLAQVSQILGHRDVRVTVMFYGTFADVELKAAHDRYGWLPDEL